MASVSVWEPVTNTTHPMIAAVAIISLAAMEKPARWRWWLACFSTLIAVIVASKLLTSRMRPDQTTRDSFPSGHAAVAAFVAAAAFVRLAERSAGGPTWMESAVAATVVAWAVVAGAARIEARRHHIGDVVVGWAIGGCAGAVAAVYGRSAPVRRIAEGS